MTNNETLSFACILTMRSRPKDGGQASSVCPEERITAGGLRLSLCEVQNNFLHKDSLFIKERTAVPQSPTKTFGG
jgi:hypothetical protein